MKRHENQRFQLFLFGAALAGVTMLAAPAHAKYIPRIANQKSPIHKQTDLWNQNPQAQQAYDPGAQRRSASPDDALSPLPGFVAPGGGVGVAQQQDVFQDGRNEYLPGLYPPDEPDGRPRRKDGRLGIDTEPEPDPDVPGTITDDRTRLDAGVQAPSPGPSPDVPDDIHDDRPDDTGIGAPAEMADIARIVDIWYVLTFWGTDDPNADVNGDGAVDILDLLQALAEDPDPDFDVRDLLWYLAQRVEDFGLEEGADEIGPDVFVELTELMWRILEMWGTDDRMADVNHDGVVNAYDFLAALRMQPLRGITLEVLLQFIYDYFGGPEPISAEEYQTFGGRPDHNLYTETTPDDPAGEFTPDETCVYDCANHDGVVDAVDLLQLLSEWGLRGPFMCDVAGPAFQPVSDGEVDVNDILALLSAWGKCR